MSTEKEMIPAVLSNAEKDLKEEIQNRLTAILNPLLSQGNTAEIRELITLRVNKFFELLASDGKIRQVVKVVCDESNNRPEQIARGEMHLHFEDEHGKRIDLKDLVLTLVATKDYLDEMEKPSFILVIDGEVQGLLIYDDFQAAKIQADLQYNRFRRNHVQIIQDRNTPREKCVYNLKKGWS